MTATAKYLFDEDFTAGSDAMRKPMSPAEIATKLAEAENKGFREGFAAAEKEAAIVTARRTAAAFEQIGKALSTIVNSLSAIELRLEAEAVELASAVARKLAPELISREPFAEISALAGECLKQLSSAPHVIVRVNDSQHEAARVQLEEIARNRAFEGRLVVVAEPEIAIGDCRVEWADGGVVRDRAKTDQAIEMGIERYLCGRPSADAPMPGDIGK